MYKNSSNHVELLACWPHSQTVFAVKAEHRLCELQQPQLERLGTVKIHIWVGVSEQGTVSYIMYVLHYVS